MERLTYKDEFGRWTADLHYGGKVEHLRDVPIDRLAAYEDICFDEDGKERITVDELSALVKAWDEGRVTISPPPAKEGDPKPDCFYDDGASLWCLGLSHEGDDEPVDRCKQCWYCESGDYADDRAEAEAALLGGGLNG